MQDHMIIEEKPVHEIQKRIPELRDPTNCSLLETLWTLHTRKDLTKEWLEKAEKRKQDFTKSLEKNFKLILNQFTACFLEQIMRKNPNLNIFFGFIKRGIDGNSSEPEMIRFLKENSFRPVPLLLVTISLYKRYPTESNGYNTDYLKNMQDLLEATTKKIFLYKNIFTEMRENLFLLDDIQVYKYLVPYIPPEDLLFFQKIDAVPITQSNDLLKYLISTHVIPEIILTKGSTIQQQLQRVGSFRSKMQFSHFQILAQVFFKTIQFTKETLQQENWEKISPELLTPVVGVYFEPHLFLAWLNGNRSLPSSVLFDLLHHPEYKKLGAALFFSQMAHQEKELKEVQNYPSWKVFNNTLAYENISSGAPSCLSCFSFRDLTIAAQLSFSRDHIDLQFELLYSGEKQKIAAQFKNFQISFNDFEKFSKMKI